MLKSASLKKVKVLLVLNVLILSLLVQAQDASILKELKEIQYQLHHPAVLNSPSPSNKDRDNNLVVPIVPINFTGSVIIDSIKRIIANTDDTYAAWQFNNMPYTTADIIANLRSHLTNVNDSALCRRQSIQLVAEYLKFSGNWENNALVPFISDLDTVGFSRLYDPIGWYYGVHSLQCGSYVLMASQLLVKMGYFTFRDFKTITFNGSPTVTAHTLIEIDLDGYFSLFDFDPGECGFSFPYAASPNGLASSQDVHDHPDLAVRATYNGAGFNMSQIEQDYQAIFTVDTPHILSFPSSLVCLPNDAEVGYFRLPAKSSIDYTIRANLVFLDAADSLHAQNFLLQLDFYTQQYQQGQSQYVDSLVQLIVGEFHISIDNAYSLFGGAFFTVYNSNTDQGKQIPVKQLNKVPIPTWDITMGNAMPDSINMPLVALAVNNNTNLGDTIGPCNMDLWQADSVLTIGYSKFNYVNSLIDKPTKLIATVNAHTLNITDEWAMQMKHGNVGVSATVDFMPQTALSIADIKRNIQMYPNPTNSLLNVEGLENMNNIQVYDVSGRLQSVTVLNPHQIYVGALAPGLYLLKKDNNVVTRFVKH